MHRRYHRPPLSRLPSRLRVATVLLADAFLCGVIFVSSARAADRVGDCRIGIHQLQDGEKVDIGATDGDHLRWRREDGTTGDLTPGNGGIWTSTLGWTDRPDGKRVTFDCNSKRITFAGVPGQRIAFDVTDVTFQGASARLAGVPADYDPMPVLRNLDTSQLWILAADDREAPSAETLRRLRGLQMQDHKPITIAMFPHTEHGIYEFETKADGTRVDTRNPDGYFKMMRDFIVTGRLQKRYGTSTVFAPVALLQ